MLEKVENLWVYFLVLWVGFVPIHYDAASRTEELQNGVNQSSNIQYVLLIYNNTHNPEVLAVLVEDDGTLLRCRFTRG